jgi:hypothetical protein
VAPFKLIKDQDGKKVSVRKHLESVVESIEDKHAPASRVVKEWRQFLQNFPSGSAEEYVAQLEAQSGKPYGETVPFPSIFRPEPGPYTEGRSAAGSAKPDDLDVFNIAEMPVAVATASVLWGPDMNMQTDRNPGFRGRGTDVNEHPRVFENHEAQGLSGPYLLPARDVDPLEPQQWGRKTISQMQTVLRLRGLSTSGNKKELQERLVEDDRRREAERAREEAAEHGDVRAVLDGEESADDSVMEMVPADAESDSEGDDVGSGRTRSRGAPASATNVVPSAAGLAAASVRGGRGGSRGRGVARGVGAVVNASSSSGSSILDGGAPASATNVVPTTVYDKVASIVGTRRPRDSMQHAIDEPQGSFPRLA